MRSTSVQVKAKVALQPLPSPSMSSLQSSEHVQAGLEELRLIL